MSDADRKKPPTPVRDLMGGPRSGSEPPASPVPLPAVELEVEGVRWAVEAAGRTRSGTSPDSGAPLLLVRFRREGEEAEAREAWAVSRSLFDLSPIQLEELLERSTPARESERDG